MVTRAGDITPATVFCLVTTVVRPCAVIILIPAVTAAVVMMMKKRAKREKVAAKRKARNDKTMIVLWVHDYCRCLVNVCCILEPVFKLVINDVMF